MKDKRNIEPNNKLDFCLLVVDPLRFDQDPNFYDYYQELSEIATCRGSFSFSCTIFTIESRPSLLPPSFKFSSFIISSLTNVFILTSTKDLLYILPIISSTGVRPFIVVTKRAHPDVHITEEELKAKFSWMPSDNIWYLENYTALQQAYRSDTEKTVLMMLHNLLLRQGVGYSQSQSSLRLNTLMNAMSLNTKQNPSSSSSSSTHEINVSDFHMIDPSPEPVTDSSNMNNNNNNNNNKNKNDIVPSTSSRTDTTTQIVPKSSSSSSSHPAQSSSPLPSSGSDNLSSNVMDMN
jgi:hypothetical protein